MWTQEELTHRAWPGQGQELEQGDRGIHALYKRRLRQKVPDFSPGLGRREAWSPCGGSTQAQGLRWAHGLGQRASYRSSLPPADVLLRHSVDCGALGLLGTRFLTLP